MLIHPRFIIFHCLRRRGAILVWSFILTAWLPTAVTRGQESEPPDYQNHIRPIFRAHCGGCHNRQKQRGGLTLDDYTGAMEGGASGTVIEPGDLDNSRLWHLVNHEDEPAMPPDSDPIPQEKRDLIRAWIAAGALEKSGDKAAAPKKSALAFQAPAVQVGEAIMPAGVYQQPVEVIPRPAAVPSIACSPVAPVLAIAAPRQVVLYHIDTGELLGVLPFPEGMPEIVKFSPDGSLLLAAGGQHSRRGWAVVFDLRSGRPLAEAGDELDTILAADLCAKLGKIAVGGPERLVRVYDIGNRQLLHEANKHNDWVQSIAYSPDGKTLASADRGGGIWLWEAETGRELKPLNGHTAAVHEICWRADSKVLASASQDGTVRIWDVNAGKQIRSINADKNGALAVVFAADGRMLTTGRDRQVKLWTAEGKPAATFGPLPDTGLCVAVHWQGSVAIAGDWQGNVLGWQTESKQQLHSYAPNPPTLQQRQALAQQAHENSKKLADQTTRRLVAMRDQLAAAVAAHENAISQAQAASDDLSRLASGDQQESSSGEAPSVKQATSLQDAVADVKQRAERAANSIQELTNQRAELVQQIDELAKENKRAEAVAAESSAQLAVVNQALSAFQNREQAMQKDLQSAEFAVQEAASRVAITRRVLDKLQQAQESVQAALQALEEVEGDLDRAPVSSLHQQALAELTAQQKRLAASELALQRAKNEMETTRRVWETSQKAFPNR